MNKNKKISTAVGGLLLCASFSASATLEPRLSGMAYYDTDTGLTWVAPKYTLDLGLNYFEYEAFMPSFVLGGTGDWEIPMWKDFRGFVYNHADIAPYDPYGAGSTPLPPLETWGLSLWYWAKDGLLEGSALYPNVFSPAMLESYPFPESPMRFLSVWGVWPVHRGDVPLVAIPEPSTYALLLAGLGLIVFSGTRNTVIKKTAIY